MAKTKQNSYQQRLKAERAAAALRERRRRERRRQLLTVVGAVVAVALVIGGGYWLNSLRNDDEAGGAKAGDAKSSAATIPGPGSPYGLTIGRATAPHQVVVYEDFLCPDCAAFEKAGQDQLAALAAAGKVQIEYRPVVTLSKYGTYSARATLMWWLVLKHDGNDVATKFHDLLYAHQPSEQGPFPSREDLYGLAGKAGADTAALKTSVENSDDAQDVVDATKKADDLGVRTMPTVLLDGTRFTTGDTPADLANNLIQAVQ